MPDIIVLIRQHLYNGLIDWQYCNRGGYMNNREAQFIAKQTMNFIKKKHHARNEIGTDTEDV